MHAMAEHYCSRHKRHLPIEDFRVKGTHIPDCCNACLENDRVRREATRAATIAETLRSSITLKDLCSELDAQKETEHLTHSISFNSEKLFDIQLSVPGDDVAELDPVTKNGKDRLKSEADTLAAQFWRLLGYRWR